MGAHCGCLSGVLETATNMKPVMSEYIAPGPRSLVTDTQVDSLYNRLPSSTPAASDCSSDLSPSNSEYWANWKPVLSQ